MGQRGYDQAGHPKELPLFTDGNIAPGFIIAIIRLLPLASVYLDAQDLEFLDHFIREIIIVDYEFLYTLDI